MRNNRTKEEYIEAIKDAESIADVCRNLGIKPIGGNYKVVRNKVNEYGLDFKNYKGKGWGKGLKGTSNKKLSLNEILVEHSNYGSYKLKQRLIDEGLKEWKCEKCHRAEWEGEKIPLELHHVNGINTDNRLENLQLLCPNCHSLTDNFRGRNKGINQEENSIKIVSKKEKIEKKITKIVKEKEIKHCLFCDKEFEGEKNQKYCSVECYRADNRNHGNRPSFFDLMEDFKKLKAFEKVGEKHQVSGNAVRKWCLLYNLPTHSKEMMDLLS